MRAVPPSGWWERCRLIGGAAAEIGSAVPSALRRPSAVARYASTNIAGWHKQAAGPMDKASGAADQPDEGAEAAAPLAAAPNKRTVRRREQRQRRHKRQKDEAAGEASGLTVSSPSAAEADGAEASTWRR